MNCTDRHSFDPRVDGEDRIEETTMSDTAFSI